MTRMFQSDGRVRKHCHPLSEYLRNLTAEEAVTIQERVSKSFLDDGIVFTVYGEGSARGTHNSRLISFPG